MLKSKIETSSILIVNSIDQTIDSINAFYKKSSIRIIRNEDKDDFLLAEASQVIKEAYICSNETKYIFLCGQTFRKEAQNSLLKILEEPPSNIVFIFVIKSKASLLATIFSRIPYIYLRKFTAMIESDLDIKKLDLKELYYFLKQNQRINKKEAKHMVESILLKINLQKICLNEEELNYFSKSIKLLELNTKPINILTMLLLSLLNSKHQSLKYQSSYAN